MNMADQNTEINIADMTPVQPHIDRRAMLTAAPAFAFSTLLATGARPASARPRETPVMLLAREWQAFHQWANGPEVHGMSESEFDEVTERLNRLVARIGAAPSTCPQDTAIKLYALAEEYQPFSHMDGVSEIMNEARQLLGVPLSPKPAFLDPHAAWLQEWREAGKAWSDALDKYGDETEHSETMWARRDMMRSKIHSTQARTLEGITAQVTWIIEESAGDFVFVGQVEALNLILAGLQRGLAA